ncbi:GNAT family N-acetyltransferase [Streptomyces sp. NPDC051183]|uniref:GNAT family N-acetyltransferase n=1 Tax=Streptomyces sp. NPDC051183 TaxID=3155165 RepID=UPI0034349C56
MAQRTDWTPLSQRDMPEIVDLAKRCLGSDGGLQATTNPSFLERRYTGTGVTAVGAFTDRRLLACGALRTSPDACVVTGLVDPAHRGRGLGARLLDDLLDLAAETYSCSGRVQLETESLTPQASALFRSRGFRQAFAEDIHRRDMTAPLPPSPLPATVHAEQWTDATQGAFHQAYRASFADRPGFPDWTRDQWVDWTVGDTFLPQCSLVARTANGAPIGFVTCEEGFLIQVGAVPQWRRRGLARALATTALNHLRGYGDTEVFLDVNVNNPASTALFQSLGFTPIARRARFEQC